MFFKILLCIILANAVKSHFQSFNKHQRSCLIDIIDNLSIKNLIIPIDQKIIFRNKIHSVFIKELSTIQVFAQFINFQNLKEYVMDENFIIKNYWGKPMIILDLDKMDISIYELFVDRNEKYLSSYNWIIFLKDEFQVENFKYFYIPYNCQFLVVIMGNKSIKILEIYNMKIYTYDQYMNIFGYWDEINGLVVDDRKFYERRFNMNGTLMAAVAEYSPNRCKDVTICLYEEIVKEMGRMMNFKLIFKNLEELGKLLDIDYAFNFEIVIGLFAFPPELYDQENIVGPLWKSLAYLHIKYIKSYEEGEAAPHIRPFTPNLWILIIIWIFLAGICISIIDYRLISKKYIYIDSFFRPFEALINQCGSTVPEKISSRLATIITRLLSLIIVFLYSAVVLSFITVRIVKYPFSDLQGLAHDASFRIANENRTIFSYYLPKSSDNLIKNVYKKFALASDEMPEQADEGLKRLCENPKLAFLAFNDQAYQWKPPCKILQIPKPIFFIWNAYKLRDDSCYGKIFNQILNSFRSSGVLEKMEKISMGQKLLEEDDGPDPVEFESIWPLCKLIGYLYLTAFSILIFEIYYHRLKIQKRKICISCHAS